MNLKAELDELRRYTKDKCSNNNSLLEKGEIEGKIEKVKNEQSIKVLELETKSMKKITQVNEDLNNKMHALQDQMSMAAHLYFR